MTMRVFFYDGVVLINNERVIYEGRGRMKLNFCLSSYKDCYFVFKDEIAIDSLNINSNSKLTISSFIITYIYIPFSYLIGSNF